MTDMKGDNSYYVELQAAFVLTPFLYEAVYFGACPTYAGHAPKYAALERIGITPILSRAECSNLSF